MSFCHSEALRCPLDGSILIQVENCLRCEHQHSFDLAREGYANLLVVQDKRSRDPGDSKAMIAARHRFLEAGYYQPIIDGMAAALTDRLPTGARIVDAGCGEGWAIRQLSTALVGPSEKSQLEFVGFDISKWAMKVAARRCPATWLVASNRNIPLADNAVDVILDMFGFPHLDEFARVIHAGGYLLRVEAGGDHLRELRQVIYPELKMRRPGGEAPSSFEVVDNRQVRYELADLGQEVIADLLLMTPHLFRASAAGKERAAQLRTLTVTVDVSISLLVKI